MDVKVVCSDRGVGAWRETVVVESEMAGVPVSFVVTGTTGQAKLDTGLLEDLSFGVAAVGKVNVLEVPIRNNGGFPLVWSAKVSWPVLISGPSSGKVARSRRTCLGNGTRRSWEGSTAATEPGPRKSTVSSIIQFHR